MPRYELDKSGDRKLVESTNMAKPGQEVKSASESNVKLKPNSKTKEVNIDATETATR